jgi:hypothetical protein
MFFAKELGKTHNPLENGLAREKAEFFRASQTFIYRWHNTFAEAGMVE